MVRTDYCTTAVDFSMKNLINMSVWRICCSPYKAPSKLVSSSVYIILDDVNHPTDGRTTDSRRQKILEKSWVFFFLGRTARERSVNAHRPTNSENSISRAGIQLRPPIHLHIRNYVTWYSCHPLLLRALCSKKLILNCLCFSFKEFDRNISVLLLKESYRVVDFLKHTRVVECLINGCGSAAGRSPHPFALLRELKVHAEERRL